MRRIKPAIEKPRRHRGSHLTERGRVEPARSCPDSAPWEADNGRLGMTLSGLMMTRFFPIAAAISFLKGPSALNAMLARSSPAARETRVVDLPMAAEGASAPHAEGRRQDTAATVPPATVDFRKLLREVKQPVVIFSTLSVTIAQSRGTASVLPIPIFR